MVAMFVGNVCNLELLQVRGKSLPGMRSGSNSWARMFGWVPGLFLPNGVCLSVVIVVAWVPFVWSCTPSCGWVVNTRFRVNVRSWFVDHDTVLLFPQVVDVLMVV